MIVEPLIRRIEEFASEIALHPLLEQAKAGKVTPTSVARYLESARFLICHTLPNLALAQEASAERGLAALVGFYELKASEERGHERWAESDLEQLSRRFGLAERAKPCAAIERLVTDLKQFIRRDPAAYLAYILFAEYFTVLMGPVWVNALEERCGLPKGSISVVSKHVELDKEHVAECRAEMSALASLADERGLHDMLTMAMQHFVDFCDELAREAPRDEKAA